MPENVFTFLSSLKTLSVVGIVLGEVSVSCLGVAESLMLILVVPLRVGIVTVPASQP